jgi:hypothetical protein
MNIFSKITGWLVAAEGISLLPPHVGVGDDEFHCVMVFCITLKLKVHICNENDISCVNFCNAIC